MRVENAQQKRENNTGDSGQGASMEPLRRRFGKKKKKKNRTAHKGNALLALALQGLSLLSLKSDQHSELYIYIYGCIYIEREKLCFRESRRVGK